MGKDENQSILSRVSTVNVEDKNGKDSLLNQILRKYKECKDITFLKAAMCHLEVCVKYINLMKEKGTAAFSNRMEYQMFEVSKLFFDRLDLLEFSLDPSLKGFKENKDCTLPSLDAFIRTPNVIETKKINFLKNLKKGDVLHLQVVEECPKDREYKLLIINKYNENERVADYFIYAYLAKSHRLEELSEPVKIGSFIRAAVFVKQKIEGSVFKKLIVTLKDDYVSDEYKKLVESGCSISKHYPLILGVILKSEIPFFPEDVSKFNGFKNYMKANKRPSVPDYLMKSLLFVGTDPYKIGSFEKSSHRKKIEKPREPSSVVEERKMQKSMKLLQEAEKVIVNSNDLASALPMVEEALNIYPLNDTAYAVRGQWYKTIFFKRNNLAYLHKALNDFDKALEINGYNFIATREYLILLGISAELFEKEKNDAKANEIFKILDSYKDVYDVRQLLAKNAEEGAS